MKDTTPLGALIARHAGHGEVMWIGLRPARRAPVIAVSEARVLDTGLEGDHARPGKRAVTLVQAEHLPVIAALAHIEAPAYGLLRRNIAVAGINLVGLRGRQVRVGTAILEVTGPCAPCSRMEEALGPGGYTAMRGHGGVTAAVISPGKIGVGDTVHPA
ncbi:MAG: MOSC domain-containing protein [Pseudomonadota bacterium]